MFKSAIDISPPTRKKVQKTNRHFSQRTALKAWLPLFSRFLHPKHKVGEHGASRPKQENFFFFNLVAYFIVVGRMKNKTKKKKQQKKKKTLTEKSYEVANFATG